MTGNGHGHEVRNEHGHEVGNGFESGPSEGRGDDLFADPGRTGGRTMHPFYSANSQLLSEGDSAWIGLLSMAMYLLFWAAVLVIVIRIFRKYFVRDGHLKGGRDTAMDILRERYAKGEIDVETFRKMKAELKEKD